MKKTMLFSAALAGLMLGACSSSEDLNPGGTGANENGKGYVNIALNLPTQKGNLSRANDNTDDGLAAEYNVKDATLLLFAGDNESSASFKAAYALEGWAKEDNANNGQISTKLTKVQEVNALSGNKIFAFVVVNKGNAFKVEDDHTLKVNDEAFTGGIADLSKKEIATKDFVQDNLMMTNAVIVDKPGSADFSSTAATTLSDVTGSIGKTEAEAKTKPAAEIFVERVAAKVTLSNSASSTGKSENGVANGDGGTARPFAYTIEKWGLANVNTKSYVTRQYDNTWNSYKSNGTDGSVVSGNEYRFAGVLPILNGQYRTYWGKDANYASDAEFPVIDESILTKKLSDIAYCNENTFNVEHQNVKNTTSAVVKVKITPDAYTAGTFYIVDNNKGVIYSENDVKTKIGNALLKKLGEDKIKQDYFSGATGTVTVKSVEFDNSKAGQVSVTKVILALGSDEKEVSAADLETLKTAIRVDEFKDGFAYYNILIKHFGDDLTPWIATNKDATSYPGTDAEQNWLGRYGVLRNNWYDIQVDGVSVIGAATPEDLKVNTDETPDDNIKRYISVKINVLSWSKRTQSTTLGQ